MELGEEEDRQSETWVMYLLCDLKEVPALSGLQISHLSMGVFLTLYLMNKGAPKGGPGSQHLSGPGSALGITGGVWSRPLSSDCLPL